MVASHTVTAYQYRSMANTAMSPKVVDLKTNIVRAMVNFIYDIHRNMKCLKKILMNHLKRRFNGDIEKCRRNLKLLSIFMLK